MADLNYFDQVPVWGNESGYNFRVMADQVSGRIPVTRLEKWQDLANILESQFFNRPGVQHIFRGHRRFDWSLAPSLARINSGTNIIVEETALQQLEQFRLAVRGRLLDRTLVDEGEDDELWAVGQHHGLMTPLLDWTHSPYVALFFAYAEEDVTSEMENEYRAIYVLNKTFVGDAELCPDIRLLQPRKDDHGRLVNQAGLFTFSPYGETIENAITNILSDDDFPDDDLKNAEMKIEEEKAEGAEEELSEAQGDAESEVLARYICKIYIKNEEREGCLRHLRRMNVHHASLFPDLIGASEYCNMLMADEKSRESFSGRGIDALKDFGSSLSGADLVPEEDKTNKAEDVSSGMEQEKGAAVKRPGMVEFIPNPEIDHGDKEWPVRRDDVMKVVSSHIHPDQMKPGMMIYMSQEIAAEIQRNATIDWDTRDTVLARIRNSIRVLLRKRGCPNELRNQIVDEVLGLVVKETPVSKHSIILKRSGLEGFASDQSIGTDALNALNSIPGVRNPEIIKESDDQVELSYEWAGEGTFWEAGEYLQKYGLTWVEKE